MEKFIRYYLRILDIDPLGYFIRLINISHNQSLDLSNICIRQFNDSIQGSNSTLTSYIFKDQIRPLLRSGEVVTIYSKGYDQIQFDIEPYIFIAQDILRWLIDDHIQTEISIKKNIFNSYKAYSLTTNDIPSLFIHRSIDSKQSSVKSVSYSNRYARFIFPYCLSNNNLVNPYTSAITDRNESTFERNSCYKNTQTIKHFDSYPRRLTTAPKSKET